MNKPKLTGKKRYRVLSRFMRGPLVVVQLEVEGFVPEYTGGASVSGEMGSWWIDALPEHITDMLLNTEIK